MWEGAGQQCLRDGLRDIGAVPGHGEIRHLEQKLALGSVVGFLKTDACLPRCPGGDCGSLSFSMTGTLKCEVAGVVTRIYLRTAAGVTLSSILTYGGLKRPARREGLGEIGT